MNLFNGRKNLAQTTALVPGADATATAEAVLQGAEAAATAAAQLAEKKKADDEKAEEEARKAKKAKSAKSKKTEDDDDNDDDDDDDGDDDSDDEEMRGQAGARVRSARMRERTRIAAILESEAGRAAPQLALRAALHTNMSRGEAMNLLAGAAAEGDGNGLAARMAGHAGRAATPGAAMPTQEQQIAKSWDDVCAAVVPTRPSRR